MATSNLVLTNEGGSAKYTILQLYQGLLSRYRGRGIRNKNFEFNYTGDQPFLLRIVTGLKTQLPPFESEYISYCLDELCRMEIELATLERHANI